MQFFQTSLLAALVASVAALQVTSPTNTSNIDLSKDIQITWSTVSSDPATFSITLVNMAVSPSVSINVADGVATSSGSYTIKANTIKSATTGTGYQVNLISKDPNNTGILAQSNQFTISSTASTASAGSGTSTASSGSSDSNSAAASASTGKAASSAAAAKASGSATGTASASHAVATGASATASAKASATGAAYAQNAPAAAVFGLLGFLALLA